MNDRQWNGQVRINKDILTYSEQAFMGLTVKQTVFGGLAIVSAIIVYFFANKFLGQQLAIILCALVAAPLAALGFITYNGMTFAQMVKAAINNFLIPKVLAFKSKSYYNEIIALNKFIIKKEDTKRNDAKNIQSNETLGKSK